MLDEEIKKTNKHGKVHEKIVNDIIGLSDDNDKDPTFEWDSFGPSIFKSFSDDVSYQLKCIKHKTTIGNGDLLRSFSHTQPFIYLVSFHKMNLKGGETLTNETPVSIRAYLIDDFIKFNKLFYFDEYYSFREQMESIPSTHDYDHLWKPILKKGQEAFKSVPRIVSMAPKRDSKNCRIQGAIPYKKYMDEFPKLFEHMDFNGFKELQDYANKMRG